MILVRSFQIAATLAALGAAAVGERLAHGRRPPEAFPHRLRTACERLGPTFVKLGQALSQRRDLLPDAWTAELSQLQEHAPPFPGEVAEAMVVRAFGGPLDREFAWFDRAPLAAASVAQVHRAQLRDGREVIVKVLRPGVRAQIDEDMRILSSVVVAASALIPLFRRRKAVEVVREMWRNLRHETDLRQEAKNVRRFARRYADSPSVFVPDVVDGLSTTEVMVQELGTGRRLGDPALAADGPRLAKAFVDVYLQQVLVIGLFHADPHPGNLFVREDGRFCFHDFGSVGWLDLYARQALLGFLMAFIHQDPDWLADSAVELGLIAAAADRAALARGIEALLAELAGAPLEEWSLAALMVSIARLGGPDGLVLPPHLAALVRTVFTAEGTLRRLDPRLDVLATFQASGERLLEDAGAARQAFAGGQARLKWEAARALAAAPTAAAEVLARARRERGFTLPLDLPEVRAASERLSRAANRIALSLVTLGLYVAASLLMQHSIGPRIFRDIPLLAAVGYALAVALSLRLARSLGPGEPER